MKITDEKMTNAALTTRYVINEGSPIVNVIYDEDGDWQFLGKEKIDESDAVIVSIKQIIEHDSTLCNIPALSCGQSAVRDNINTPWRVELQ